MSDLLGVIKDALRLAWPWRHDSQLMREAVRETIQSAKKVRDHEAQ